MNNVDIIYKKMKDDTETVPPRIGESQIQKFFAGKTIFATDVTGFLGKCLLEKLLRSCKDVKRIYILLEPIEKMTMEQQMKQLSEDVIFDNLRKISPNFMEKVEPLEGDQKKPCLGLSKEAQQKIIEEVNIIYRNAEDRHEKLAMCLKVDVLGTKELLELAMNCKQLAAFVYISTAYSHGYQLDIEEVFYPAPADLKMTLDIVQAATENEAGLNDDVVPTILGQWPNVHTFTKATAEDLVRLYGSKASFSCAIYRPSIVIPAYKEPSPGWCDNLTDPATVFPAMGLGYFRIGYTKDESFDVVPVDMCTNALIALTWDIIKNKKYDQISIFNYGSSKVNPITFRRIYEKMKPSVRAEPSVKSIWYPGVIITRCYPMFLLGHILLHFLPAVIMDALSLLQGKMPTLVPLYLKKQKSADALTHLAVTGFHINVKQIAKMWDRMVVADQEIFFCDLREINWDAYMENFWRGLRIFAIKDPVDTIPEAREKHGKLRIVHYAVIIFITLLMLYLKSGAIYAVFKYFVK